MKLQKVGQKQGKPVFLVNEGKEKHGGKCPLALNFKLTVVRIFTRVKSSKATSQGFSCLDSQLLNVYQCTTAYGRLVLNFISEE